MRIAFLDSWWRDPVRGSGTAVGIRGLAGGLAALGHEVVPVGPAAGARGRLSERLAYNLALPGRLRGEKFDLTVGFDWDGCLLKRGALSPYVVALKGVSADEAAFERGLARLALSLQARLEDRNARRADRVVTPSRYSAARAVAAYGLDPARVRVVPEGIDPAAWGNGATPRDGRPPVILSVAHQYPRKNTATLLSAMPAVRARVPDARLRVVGGGPELVALRHAARGLGLDGAVTFLGEVPDDDAVRREYAGAAVFCLPSMQEGFGLVFLEAMAAGLPVVAGDAAAVPEVVPDGEAGLLVPPEDADALARALADLLADPARRARMGAAGRTRAEAHAWPRIAARFLDAVAS